MKHNRRHNRPWEKSWWDTRSSSKISLEQIAVRHRNNNADNGFHANHRPAQRTSTPGSIEIIVEDSHGFFERAINQAYSRLSDGLNYLGSALGKITSFLPDPVKRYSLASVPVVLLLYAAACGKPAPVPATEPTRPAQTATARPAPTPTHNPVPSTISTPVQEPTSTPEPTPTTAPTLIVTSTSKPTYKPTPTPSPTTTAMPTLSPTQTPEPPAWVANIAQDYPFVYEVGNVRVYSDISQEFSREHAAHLKKVWDFFSRLYAGSRGKEIEVFYTRNAEVFLRVVPYCPTIVIPGARNLTACYDEFARWFIQPHTTPDFNTLQHEIGHDFLFATWHGSENSQWFKEGTGMYFESGKFNDNGTLIVTQPAPFCTDLYRRYRSEDRLIPLEALANTPKPEFLADAERRYSQSCIFFHYLNNEHPNVLPGMIDRINRGEVKTNPDLISVLTSLTGMSLAKLDTAYKKFAERY